MRTCKWMLTAFLLITLSAVAQQSANQSSSNAAPANAAASQPATAAQPAASQPANPASGQSAAAASAAMAPPTTMDQVVDRTILREHGLMELLKTRTPLVETYLQNLKADPKLGAVPSEDHYFSAGWTSEKALTAATTFRGTRASRKICWAASASCSSLNTSPWASRG